MPEHYDRLAGGSRFIHSGLCNYGGTVGVPQQGGGVREHYDRLIGGGRLITSSLQ